MSVPNESDADSIRSFFREDLRVIYQATMDDRLDHRGRIWATATAAAVLSGTLIAFVGGILASDILKAAHVPFLGAIVVIEGIVLALWTWTNLRREQIFQLEKEFTLNQIERLLGLHQEIPIGAVDSSRVGNGNRWLPDASHMFGAQHIYPERRHDSPDPVSRWATNRFESGRFKREVMYGLIVSTAGLLVVSGLFLIWISHCAV